MNVNERLTSKISDLERLVQELRDEISRLKGGNAKPEFKKTEEKRDWSSGGKEKESGGFRGGSFGGGKRAKLKITKIEVHTEVGGKAHSSQKRYLFAHHVRDRNVGQGLLFVHY